MANTVEKEKFLMGLTAMLLGVKLLPTQQRWVPAKPAVGGSMLDVGYSIV